MADYFGQRASSLEAITASEWDTRVTLAPLIWLSDELMNRLHWSAALSPQDVAVTCSQTIRSIHRGLIMPFRL